MPGIYTVSCSVPGKQARRNARVARLWENIFGWIFGRRCDHCGVKLEPGDTRCGECQELVSPATDGGRHG